MLERTAVPRTYESDGIVKEATLCRIDTATEYNHASNSMDSTVLLEFFDSLATEADLQRLIDERTQESIYLEFKQKKDPRSGALHESDSRQFSRALSGFANSAGGILLWGIETDSEERANHLRPIHEHRDFQGRLKKSMLNAVTPMLDNVRIEVIDSAQSAASGYVKCLIPESERLPHRAMLADREYYKRSTEGFYRLEHFDLVDLFGRRPVPVLELVYRLLPGGGSRSGGGSSVYYTRLILSVENSGRGSARSPYVKLRVHHPYVIYSHGLDGNGHEGLQRVYTANHADAVYSSDSVTIYPGVTHDVAAIEVVGHLDHPDRITMPADLHLDYEMASDGTPLISGAIHLGGDVIADAVFPANLDWRNQAGSR